ncbi:MAG: DNA repair protein RecN [Mycobacteriales bacterium]
MLEEIRVADLGVIARAKVPIGPGLTVLTGETGAGKTMLLEAVDLLLGGRGDSGLVRPGAKRALVEGRFRLAPDHPALLRARDAGAELDDDGSLVLLRTLSAEGRSRCAAGGAAVPVSLLAELGEDLVAVHGQADQQRLARPAVQRQLVDRYAGPDAAGARRACADLHADLSAARAELAEITDRAQDRALEADGLRHALGLIAALRPVPGEEQDTAQVVARLAHAEALAVASRQAHELLVDAGESDARARAVAARRLVEGAADLDPTLAPLVERIAEGAMLLEDAARDLISYAEGLVVDPDALAAAQERTAALTGLVRRYVPGQDAAALAAWAADAERRLADLDGDDGRRDAVGKTVVRLESELDAASGRLTALRRSAADRLVAEVQAELVALAMPAAAIGVEITPIAPGPSGADHVTMTLTAHPGAPARPIARGASGGELSRIMLALEVALARADPVPTMVFDEVDAGVGGQAAVEVGRRLGRLAGAHQVLVVTHLAQVAAFAGHHVRVRKASAGGITASDVSVLDDAARAAELARMLGGDERSRPALEHARELLALTID